MTTLVFMLTLMTLLIHTQKQKQVLMKVTLIDVFKSIHTKIISNIQKSLANVSG